MSEVEKARKEFADKIHLCDCGQPYCKNAQSLLDAFGQAVRAEAIASTRKDERAKMQKLCDKWRIGHWHTQFFDELEHLAKETL